MFGDRSVTLKYFEKSAELYDIFYVGVMATYYNANSYLERAIVSELNGQPNPAMFRAALRSFESMRDQLSILDQKFDELIKIDGSGQQVKTFEDALEKILKEAPPFERLSTRGVRYANIGGGKKQPAPQLRSSSDILRAQREDLQTLRKALDEAIAAFREALPLAEKGEFVTVMLSGRNAFGDKMPKFADMVSAYDRFNVRTCMATIDATMQVYPAGFEWLKKRPVGSSASPDVK